MKVVILNTVQPMKRSQLRTDSDKAKVATIPAAYDLDVALRNCHERGLHSREALAWLAYDGTIQISFNSDSIPAADLQAAVDALFKLWGSETEAQILVPIPIDKSHQPFQPLLRCVRCVAYTDGGRRWTAWEPDQVIASLSSDAPIFPDNEWDHTYINPEQNRWIWEGEVVPTESDRVRSVKFALRILYRVAGNVITACNSVEGFKESFFEHQREGIPASAVSLTLLLLSCRNVAKQLINSTVGKDNDPTLLEPSTALHLGLQLGEFLAEAEARIANERVIKLGAHVGRSGQHPSKFRAHIVEPEYAGKSSTEVLGMLDGKIDPDFPGMKMKLTDEGLKRGNGSILKRSSFEAILSRQRKKVKLSNVSH